MHGTVAALPQVKHRTITLTNRAPIRIVEDEWPVIAQGISCYAVDGAPYSWEVAIRVRRKKESDISHIVHANYSRQDDDFEPDNGADKYNQTVRVGREFHTELRSSSGVSLSKQIFEVGEELKARILDPAMHVFVMHAVDRCFAALPARDW